MPQFVSDINVNSTVPFNNYIGRPWPIHTTKIEKRKRLDEKKDSMALGQQLQVDRFPQCLIPPFSLTISPSLLSSHPN